MTLYVIRHGQTNFNAEGRFQGRMDIPLNDFGRSQAKGNGEKLKTLLAGKPEDYDFVSSPLGRARETMEIVRQEMGLDLKQYRTDPQLAEISFGDFEGHTLDELSTSHPDLIAAREQDKWNFLPPGEGSESYDMLAQRVKGASDAFSQKTVCVCHGGVIRAILHNLGTTLEASTGISQVPQDKILTIKDNQLDWV